MLAFKSLYCLRTRHYCSYRLWHLYGRLCSSFHILCLQAAREARNQATTSPAELAMLREKIPDLDERLKHVYVTSEGKNPEIQSSKKLPQDRGLVSFFSSVSI